MRILSYLVGFAEFKQFVVVHIPLVNQLGQSLALRRLSSHCTTTTRSPPCSGVLLQKGKISSESHHRHRRKYSSPCWKSVRTGKTCCSLHVFTYRSVVSLVCVPRPERRSAHARKGELICKWGPARLSVFTQACVEISELTKTFMKCRALFLAKCPHVGVLWRSVVAVLQVSHDFGTPDTGHGGALSVSNWKVLFIGLAL